MKHYGHYRIILVYLLLTILVAGCSHVEEQEKAEAETVDFIFFHETGCGSCDGEKEFRDIVSEQISPYKEIRPYTLSFYNMFKSEERKEGAEVLAQYGLDAEKLSYPVMILDGEVYERMDEIRQNIKSAYLNKIGASAIYFYREDCDECNCLKPYMDGLPETVAVDGTEVEFTLIQKNSREGDNGKLIREMFKVYSVPDEDQMVPFVFLRDCYLAGEEEIQEKLLPLLEKGCGLGLPEIE